MLVEVTSSVSLDMCKKVMDELIKRTLEMGVGKCSQEGEASAMDGATADGEEGKLFSGGGRGDTLLRREEEGVANLNHRQP